jgi:hypothetical protein
MQPKTLTSIAPRRDLSRTRARCTSQAATQQGRPAASAEPAMTAEFRLYQAVRLFTQLPSRQPILTLSIDTDWA